MMLYICFGLVAESFADTQSVKLCTRKLPVCMTGQLAETFDVGLE